MRVSVDVAQTCTERAGCAWYACGLATALSRRSDISLELLHHFGGWINESTTSGTILRGCEMPLFGSDRDLAARYWERAATHGLPSKPDIIVSTSFQAPFVAASHLVYTFYDASFWTHPEYTTETNRLVCQRGVLEALGRASGFAFISEAARNDFERTLPGWLDETRRPHAIVSPAGRHPPRVRAAVPRPDAPWLCVGSIEPRKNHKTLLAAFGEYCRKARAARPLWIVGGRGWLSDETQAIMDSMAPEGLVRYLGYVSDDRLADLYSTCFALIQPSWHEGFGLPVLEAMSFGTPVICSNIPSHREVGGEAVLYCQPECVSAWTKAMNDLDNDVDHWRLLRDQSWSRQQLFSWDRSVEAALSLFREILGASL